MTSLQPHVVGNRWTLADPGTPPPPTARRQRRPGACTTRPIARNGKNRAPCCLASVIFASWATVGRLTAQFSGPGDFLAAEQSLGDSSSRTKHSQARCFIDWTRVAAYRGAAVAWSGAVRPGRRHCWLMRDVATARPRHC